MMWTHRHGHVEQRRPHLLAEERPVSCIIGMSHKRDASRQEFRTRGIDLDRLTPLEALNRLADLKRRSGEG